MEDIDHVRVTGWLYLKFKHRSMFIISRLSRCLTSRFHPLKMPNICTEHGIRPPLGRRWTFKYHFRNEEHTWSMYRSRRDSGNAWGRAKDVKLENLDQITRVQPNSCKTLFQFQCTQHTSSGCQLLTYNCEGQPLFSKPFCMPSSMIINYRKNKSDKCILTCAMIFFFSIACISLINMHELGKSRYKYTCGWRYLM